MYGRKALHQNVLKKKAEVEGDTYVQNSSPHSNLSIPPLARVGWYVIDQRMEKKGRVTYQNNYKIDVKYEESTRCQISTYGYFTHLTNMIISGGGQKRKIYQSINSDHILCTVGTFS